MTLAGIARVAIVVLVLWGVSPAEAQQTRNIPRVGYLSLYDAAAAEQRLEMFRLGLRDAGYTEGQNVVIQYRWAGGSRERLTGNAGELVRLGVEVIFAPGPEALEAARRATTTIPIVTTLGADPVAQGYVDSLSRPGGNMTGLMTTYPELPGKQLQLLKEIKPDLIRVATLWDTNTWGPATAPLGSRVIPQMQAAAARSGLQLLAIEVRGPDDIERAVDAAATGRVAALRVGETETLRYHRTRIAVAALKKRLPVIGQFPESAEAGYLLTYGVDLSDLHRRAGGYAAKILKGAKAGEIPIEQPTKLRLVVNLRVASKLGLTVPQAILLRADEVIR